MSRPSPESRPVPPVDETPPWPGAIEAVRALADAGETELAAIEAIKAVAAPPKPGLAPAEDTRERAALWNDLGVLRFARGDLRTARACLREALRLDPRSPLAAKNLADLKPLVASAASSVDALLVRGPENQSPWVREGLAAVARRPGIRGKRVLEVGGVVPRELVATTGVAAWVACEPNAPVPHDEPSYTVLRADARALPFPDGSFDVAFSSCAFEHIHDLGHALEEIARVLRTGGTLFTQFAPIWTCSLGHHLFLEETTRGRVTFNDPLLPDWAHLLLEPGELEAFLVVALGPKDARRAVDFVTRSPYLNRNTEADFTRLFAAAPLELVHRRSWGTKDRLTPGLAHELRRRHPGAGAFDVPGIRALLVKPARGEGRPGVH